MPRPFRFVAVFCLLTLGAVAEEPTPTATPAPARRTSSLAREAIKDFKFQPKEAAPAEVSAVLLPQSAETPVMLPTYTVRGLPDRTYHDLTEAFAQQERLQSPALMKVDLTKKIRLEILPAPKLGVDGAAQPRFNVEIFRLSW
jgi:hypothetical protein